MTTQQDAMDAFAGESQANRKYQAFSEKAAAEGFKNIATLYKAASEAEAIHAKKLLKVLGAVGPTANNLEGSIAGETHEYTSMYPSFIRDAEAEKKSDAVLAFTHAMKAEEVHAGKDRFAVYPDRTAPALPRAAAVPVRKRRVNRIVDGVQDVEDPGAVVYAHRVLHEPWPAVLIGVEPPYGDVEFLHAVTVRFSIPSRFFAMNVWP